MVTPTTRSPSSRHLNNAREKKKKTFLRKIESVACPGNRMSALVRASLEHEIKLGTANDVIKNVIKKMATFE